MYWMYIVRSQTRAIDFHKNTSERFDPTEFRSDELVRDRESAEIGRTGWCQLRHEAHQIYHLFSYLARALGGPKNLS